ncbi:MAG: hypothetical protein L0Z50_14395 [Verrucomicrobiales bacterium]|nr:hypothetical protein [Verrucomicrobiales bacterium]
MNNPISSQAKLKTRATLLGVLWSFHFLLYLASAADATAEVKNLSINGGLQDGKARLVIEAALNNLPGQSDKLIYATALQHSVKVGRDKLTNIITATLEMLQGEPKELPFTIMGDGEIRQVTGAALQDWSVRQETNGTRLLVLRPRQSDRPITQLAVTILAEQELRIFPEPLAILTLTPLQPALCNGYVKVEATPEFEVRPENPSGLVPIESKFLPVSLRGETKPGEPETLAFRFHGSTYSLPLKITLADPEARQVVLRDFKLSGHIKGQTAAFTLIATARVKNSSGGSLSLLSGHVALTSIEPDPNWRLRFEKGHFVAVFDQPGEFPIRLKFHATVKPDPGNMRGWNAVDFRVAPSTLQPILLQGLATDTQFQFFGGARPERAGEEFVSFLPPDGAVQFSWQESRREAEGKLFYATEMLSEISVGPGLMRQTALLDFKVMQGELNRISLLLRGAGEVTRVHGEQVIAWRVDPVPNSTDRRLVVQFNQPQKDVFAIQVQMQTPLGAFPQAADLVQLRPEDATRFAGHFRIVNDGAVRLEVLQANGLSQISPEQFPESDAIKAVFRASGAQRFAYRFAGADFALRIQADQILPELAVSQVLTYHLGENELAIDTEIELDIRDAPVRDLFLRIPRGYAIARISASGLSDYFVRESPGEPDAELRLVYGQPATGRQVIQLRFEQNQALGTASWSLPHIELSRAKSVRGHLAVSADTGFRLTPERTRGLAEIATAFFPRKVPGIQSAFRLSDPSWETAMRVERLPQTVQADVFHLFSIGEGIAYGSSMMNYMISGAPMSAFRVELSGEYFNVEFTGKDIRNWQKTTNGYLVQLHSPVAGAYTLLATYERPFRPQGETLAFAGARPLDAQAEQGHTLVTSAYQFQISAVEVSSGLLPLETGEVPPVYRLFFDTPILAAYRYTTRPFNLRLALSPLVQGDSLSQVVARASLVTRISKEGQALTDALYFVKNRGHPHFRLTLPEGTELWSATVNGSPVVPVTDAKANLLPLPQRADPNAVLTLELKLAARSKNPKRVSVATPILAAPVMLAEWKLEPDTGQRLVYRKGSLTPVGGVTDSSGFAELARIFRSEAAGRAAISLTAVLLLIGISVLVWRWTCREGVYKFSARHWSGIVLGFFSLVLAILALTQFADLVEQQDRFTPRQVTLLAPVQKASSGLSVEVANLEDAFSALGFISHSWPALFALVVWAYGVTTDKQWIKRVGWILGWLLIAWAALRWPNGLLAFLAVTLAFLLLHAVIPGLRQLWELPEKPKPAPTPPSEGGTASALATVLVGGLLWLSLVDGTYAAAALDAPFPQGHPLPIGWGEGRGEGKQRAQQLLVLAKASSEAGTASSTAPSRLQIGDTADYKPALLSKELPLAESVKQNIRVEENFALATAKVRWRAAKGQMLPLLFEPAVLTRITFLTNALKLIQASSGSKRAPHLYAQEAGEFDIEVEYQLQVTRIGEESGFAVPTQYGLINELQLTLASVDVDVQSSQAVSIHSAANGGSTVAALVLSPVGGAWIGWKPRTRDVKREKPVFYAEAHQLYVPLAGVIEGAHHIAIRPAQGELSEVIFDVPSGATITDVVGETSRTNEILTSTPNSELRTPSSNQGRAGPTVAGPVSLWRFDPDTRKVRVSLTPPQARPFSLLIRSQISTGPLPFEREVGVLSVENAAGQIGLLGIATGNEVQLETVSANALSPINLEDFPSTAGRSLQARIPGLTVRRAFRYMDATATASMKALAVEPDVRVETQDTVSLGEDRIVLASNAKVDITRAGIFRLSFLLPTGLDVESITGPALSHWTELRADAGKVITLNLSGKTQGQHQFAISLSGPGVKATNAWTVPQLVLREANKQRGTLMIVPQPGIRLQVGARVGVTQLDPQKSGVRQKGVLAFRLLQVPWTLTLALEQVDPWIQVTSLQHATVNEAQVKVAANIHYQIENTGLKAFRLSIPTNAESVVFRGEQVSDFRPLPGAVTNGLQQWEVTLHRRVIGSYLLQARYQTRMVERATEVTLRGVQAADVNLQRGFVAVQSDGRLLIRVDATPSGLQPAEWQSIPRTLQQDLPTAAADLAYRLVEPFFQLLLKIDRREATKLLPARVHSVNLTSVISDDGVMLTQARLEMLPGDKRLLYLTLPKDARFWFAFVNQTGVWPWREQDRILVPLEKQSRDGKPTPVEIFYSSQIGAADNHALDLELLAPKFDLPLENIAWHVYLNEKWQLKDWRGTLQLQEEKIMPHAAALDPQAYLRNEAIVQREKTKEAEQMLALGNTALEKGDPQQARRAFQAAYDLSQGDDAFNEDTRVQLNNLKLQQALMGLNLRQATVGAPADSFAGKVRELRSRRDFQYTQQDARAIIDSNTAEENAAFMRLAQRLIQHQSAAASNPATLRAAVSEQGRLLIFKRAVAVDSWADLRIELAARAAKTAPLSVRLLILACTLSVFALFAWTARSFHGKQSEPVRR